MKVKQGISRPWSKDQDRIFGVKQRNKSKGVDECREQEQRARAKDKDKDENKYEHVQVETYTRTGAKWAVKQRARIKEWNTA